MDHRWCCNQLPTDLDCGSDEWIQNTVKKNTVNNWNNGRSDSSAVAITTFAGKTTSCRQFQQEKSKSYLKLSTYKRYLTSTTLPHKYTTVDL